MELEGRVIKQGTAFGIALVSPQPLGFLGGVDPDSGVVIEPGHALEGQCVTGRVLVFPTGKGSTVGSYTLYRMARSGTAPAAILNAESEPIVAVGAIISGIPMVDQVDITKLRTGDWVQIEGSRVAVNPMAGDKDESGRNQGEAGPLVFVKLGGSVITDKTQPETARPDVIRRLAGEIARTLAVRPRLRLVVGHGSGSFGHVTARRHGTRRGVQSVDEWRGFVQVAAVAARLNRLVVDLFLESGVPVWSLQPSASAWCRGGDLVSLATAPVEMALAQGLVPLIYGDVALDELQGGTIISTEQILAYLVRQLHPSHLVLVSQVDGVYDRDPLRDPSARPVPEISAANWPAVRAMLSGSHAPDVTGGMQAKVQEMIELVRDHPGLTVRILSGAQDGALEAALLDPGQCTVGTLIQWP
jgi:isopentenyl phosphate kinase